MTFKPYDSDGDDCAEALAALTKPEPEITLTGYQARTIFDALRAADEALRGPETSKVWNIRKAAAAAREQVTTAWGIVDKARAEAERVVRS